MVKACELLVIGSGPYGLAVAARAREQGVDTIVVGQTMEFWKASMPSGMLLRSGPDWHIDPQESFTYRSFARAQQWGEQPIPLECFQAYAHAFAAHHQLLPQAARVQHLAYTDSKDSHFLATLESAATLRARNVAICAGFGPFANLSHWLSGSEGVDHAVALPDFAQFAGQSVLVVGGRQSAFECAALLAENGARQVHVVCRHAIPDFAPSDWSWVEAMMECAEHQPGWFSRLSPAQQEAIGQRFWAEGRLKLEPWLGPRLQRPEVEIWPGQEVVCRDGRLFGLSSGVTIQADRVVLATGYRMDLSRLSYLCAASVLAQVQTDQGFPLLDSGFQSSLAGLYFTSFASTRSHGPFFGFVRGCPLTARLLVDSVVARTKSPKPVLPGARWSDGDQDEAPSDAEPPSR